MILPTFALYAFLYNNLYLLFFLLLQEISRNCRLEMGALEANAEVILHCLGNMSES